MPKCTFWVRAVAIHPVIAISGINPGTLTMTKLAFIPLFASKRRRKKVDTVGVLLDRFFFRRQLPIRLHRIKKKKKFDKKEWKLRCRETKGGSFIQIDDVETLIRAKKMEEEIFEGGLFENFIWI